MSQRAQASVRVDPREPNRLAQRGSEVGRSQDEVARPAIHRVGRFWCGGVGSRTDQSNGYRVLESGVPGVLPTNRGFQGCFTEVETISANSIRGVLLS